MSAKKAEKKETKPSVVIVGGGFAGVGCAKKLADHDIPVTLLDRHNYQQFQPLLYQVATAELATTDVARPLRAIFAKDKSVTMKQLAVTSIDPETRTVTTSDGQTFSGDYVVIAAGTQPNFFHTPGADKFAFPLYSVQDATKLRAQVFEVFEESADNPARIDQGALNFVIVGAGPTGVETAGALADLVNQVMPKRFHTIAVDRAQIYLVDLGQVVLRAFSEKAHAYAAERLQRNGVKLMLGTGVKEVRKGKVILSDDTEILTRTVIWGGGIQAAPIAANAGLPTGRGGRLATEPDLTVEGHERVYVIGDIADDPRSRRQRPAPARLGGPAVGALGGREHPRRHRRQAPQALPLQGQGHHGDDRRRRRDRRDGQAPPRAPWPCRLRRVARRACMAHERGPHSRRRIRRMGQRLRRCEPCELDHRRQRQGPDRLG